MVMLKGATVTIRENSGEAKSATLHEAYEAYTKSIVGGGPKPFEILCYNAQTSEFKFSKPNYFHPKVDVATLVTLEVELPNKSRYQVMTDVLSRIMVTTTPYSSHSTAMTVAALKNFRTSQVKIAYCEDGQSITYLPLLRVFDTAKDIQAQNTAEVAKAQAEKREAKLQEVPRVADGDVVIIENNDGSFILCDKLLFY